MDLLNLKKRQEEREVKEYQKQCQDIFALIRAEMIKREWTVQQSANFINRVLPEEMRFKIDSYILKKKFQEVVLEELEGKK